MNVSSIRITTPVYINNSLHSYYKMLWQKCKKFWSSKFIHTFWVSSGSIKLKIADNDRVYTITHNNDLEELFPGNEHLLESKWNEQLLFCCVYYTVDFCWVYVQFCNFLANFCNSATFCYYIYIIFYKSYKSHLWSFTFFMCNVICIVL